MFNPFNIDLGDEIKAEIGNQVILLLLFLYIGLAILLSDVEPAINSIYAVPAVTLTLVFLVVITVGLMPKGYAVYRWAPIAGFVIILPLVIYTYHQPGILFLAPVAALAALILINLEAGIFLAGIESVFIFLSARWIPLTPDEIPYAIAGIWLGLATGILAIRVIAETIEELNKKYRENQVLLNEAREKQGKLNELIQERTEGNIQLARLNQLNNHLRQIAEDERKIKEEFVARVSHELRTPLNMIIGYCTVLMEANEARVRRLPQAVVEDLEVILRNSQHLSNLINDILDLSQIDAGQMAIVKSETDIGEAIAEAISSVQPLYESKGLYLNTVIQEPLPKINCDRTRIVEILLNLLSNAGRYTQEGGVTVQAQTVNRSLEVRVIDTGIGIPRHKQARLFDPFYQVDSSIRRSYGGTGLGLSISKKIVELHNGRMWVESEEGKGSVFIFQLPIDETALDPRSARRWFNPHQADFQGPAHPLDIEEKIKPRMVIVDPDGDLTALLRRYAGEGEYVPVADLNQGVQELNQTPARLMVVNSEQISSDLEILRCDKTMPFGTPAILCSIPTSQHDRAKWNISDILVKPISQKGLMQSITRLGPQVKTVLVVDDDPDTRRLMKRMIHQKNREIEVLTASNGIHALQTMKRHTIDLILLDLVMPRMDGYQFLEAKKNIPGYQDTPVILISAHQIHERPVVSDGLGIMVRGGITIQQFIQCLSALSATLGS